MVLLKKILLLQYNCFLKNTNSCIDRPVYTIGTNKCVYFC